MSMENNDRYDHIIEGSLARRAEIPQRLGLEQRLLAVVAEQEQPAPAGWTPAWKWSFATLAAMLMLSVAWWAAKPRSDVPTVTFGPKPQVRQHAVTAPPKSATTEIRTASRFVSPVPKRQSQVVARAEEPRTVKQDVFPSPGPLSEEERMLLSFVRRSRPEAIVAAARPDRFHENTLEQSPASPQLLNQTAPGNTYRNTD